LKKHNYAYASVLIDGTPTIRRGNDYLSRHSTQTYAHADSHHHSRCVRSIFSVKIVNHSIAFVFYSQIHNHAICPFVDR
jgi:hypothetical protein